MNIDKLAENKPRGVDKFTRRFTMMYLAIVLLILLLIIVAIAASLFGKPSPNMTSPSPVFAIILTGIAIVLTTALVIPKVLLGTEVATQAEGLREESIPSLSRDLHLFLL